MSDNLRDVWFEVENLLNQNVSIIPVRDRDEIYNAKLYEAKTPYKEWKKYQFEIIDRAILFDQMQRFNTTAIAMVCGAISGNLEVIDFDVKYKPGIDAIVISAIRELYPEILAKMRQHRTRSGGTHLVYRIAAHEVPPSIHLAERPATEEEIQANPKGKKTRCFIETRGTGGLATAPPSLGYAIINNIPIAEITWEERCSIIEFCKSYTEYFPEEKPYLPPKSEQAYYDENPFEHYNRTVDPVELLSGFGWEYVKKHGDYIWFTRPGGRKGDVHAGYNLNTHTYRVWGTKADLDSERSYTPSTILAHYRFQDDKSLTYHHLVQNGYGRIKPAKEREMARRYATNGKPLPANISPAAAEQYTQLVEQLQTAHPHGTYWEIDIENGEESAIISRLSFKEVATKLGFRLYKEEILQIEQQFIYRRDLRYFFDTLRNYIKEEDPGQYELIYNATQAFLEKHGKFESTQLDFLDIGQVLNDTRTACYKFYLNGYVQITCQGYQLISYDTITEKLVWHEKIQQREFVCKRNDNGAFCESADNNTVVDNVGLYTAFLKLACDLDNNRDHIMKTIGWLAHDYKNTNTAYIVVLVEKCADPKDGGGSGKNMFCDLLNHTTTYKGIPAGQKKNLDGTNLLQAWKGEKIYGLSDAKKDFDFELLKEPSGGNAIHKKLFKDEDSIGVKEVPKFIVLTNFSYEITDGGLRRRIIAIEFTSFFTIAGGVDKHFGKFFPDDWSADDWADYDTFICQCIQIWIAGGLKLKPIELEGSGWDKQFSQTYGQYTYEFINEKWHILKDCDFISNADFNKLLDDWIVENGINPHKFKPTIIKLNKALEEWCKKHDYIMEKNFIRTVNTIQDRGRKFYPPGPLGQYLVIVK